MPDDIDRPKVLIADDEPMVLGTLARGLRKRGYEVFEAADGDQAQKCLSEHFPDIAILDIRMPGMSGIEVAERAQAVDVPVLFLSAYSDQRLVDDALTKGAMGYLVKPIRVQQIVPAIEAVLRRSSDIRGLVRTVHKCKVIHCAVGIIMKAFMIDENEAFGRLRYMARSRRIKLDKAAAEVVCGISHLSQLGTPVDAKRSQAANE